LTQDVAALKIGIKYRTYQTHEAGQIPNRNTLKKYIDFYGCDRNWLLTGEGEPYINKEIISAGGKVGEGGGGYGPRGDTGQGVTVPEIGECDPALFGLVPRAEAVLSAGGGAFVASERMREYYAFRKDWLRRVSSGRNGLVLLGVRGTSMEPTIQPGDMVMIDAGNTAIHDGGIYALGLGETIVIKRLAHLAGGRIRIISDNKAEFPPEEVSLPDIRVLGRVIWFARELVREEE